MFLISYYTVSFEQTFFGEMKSASADTRHELR